MKNYCSVDCFRRKANSKPRWLTDPGAADHHVRCTEYAVVHLKSRALALFYEVVRENRTLSRHSEAAAEVRNCSQYLRLIQRELQACSSPWEQVPRAMGRAFCGLFC